MTAALSPELAVAYVRELSADVRGAVVLDRDGRALAGPPGLVAAARVLSAQLDHGAVRLPEGLVIVARGPGRTVVVVAGPHALVGPHALDAAAAAGSDGAPQLFAEPSPPLCAAALKVLLTT